MSAVTIDAITDLTGVGAELATVLQTCVNGGAAVGFLAPLAHETAVDFWSSLVPELEAGSRVVLVARDDAGRIVGTGQLRFSAFQTGWHRAEIAKVMVLPSHRGRGIASRLMRALETVAQQHQVWLVYLDTSEGPGGARGFYENLGYVYAGGIPDFARDPDGSLARNAIYYRVLASGEDMTGT